MSQKNNIIVSSINVHKICRICLLETENTRNIYTELNQDEILELTVSTLSDVLGKITSIPVNENDGLPAMVCTVCISLMLSAYKFKIQFDYSHNLLEQYKLNNVKEEDKLGFYNCLKSEGGTECDNCEDGSDSDRSKAEVVGKIYTSKKQMQKRNGNRVNTVEIKPKMRNYRRKQRMKEENLSFEYDDEIEKKPVLHPCPICTKEFTALELKEHAQTHKALKRYLNFNVEHKVSATTKFCAKPELRSHIVSLHNRKDKLHKCVYCGIELLAADLRIHLHSHKNQAEYKCDQCERVFKKLNHLNTHRVKHLKEFPYKCEKCGKGFVIKTNYDCHVLTHDTNQELPHECRVCFKRFSNPEHLNRHMVSHTENVSYSVKYKVCKCHYCLKSFKDRYDLKTHVCVPVEQAVNTKFPCKTCNKIFKNASGLYNHKRNIHQLKGAKVLCSVCGNYVSNIYNHMMRHSGEKPFQCNQCGKRFIAKPQLKQHLLVHSGLKPFVCSVCAKAFNNLYNLQVHERIHKGDRCHICNICNKGFLEKSYLKKHMNVHTKL